VEKPDSTYAKVDADKKETLVAARADLVRER
jgi:hypothetical protein